LLNVTKFPGNGNYAMIIEMEILEIIYKKLILKLTPKKVELQFLDIYVMHCLTHIKDDTKLVTPFLSLFGIDAHNFGFVCYFCIFFYK